MKSLKVKADLKAMDDIRGFLNGILGALPFSDDDASSITLAVHEICVNIALYAYPEDKGEIGLMIWTEGSRLFIEIRDAGVPFDPRSAVDPDIREKVDSARMGGWGIFLTRNLMDGFDYRREGGENILLLSKVLPDASPDDRT